MVFALTFGLAGSAAFEQDHRINSLTLQFGTDSFATNNAIGGSFVGGSIRAQIQSSFNSKITDGTSSLLFTMPGLNDLTGTNETALQVGIVNGTPRLPPGNPSAYSGGADLDWWYLPKSNEVDAAGVALQQIAGAVAASVLNAGPGRLTFATNNLFDGGRSKCRACSSARLPGVHRPR